MAAHDVSNKALARYGRVLDELIGSREGSRVRTQFEAMEYELLPPPAASFIETPFCTRSSISRRAVSCEHLASFAHFNDVSLPSKPLRS
jgi:hypothetical protein